MAYFPNGTSGACYEEQYCQNCVHGSDGCAIMDAHNFYNYDQCNEDDRGVAIKSILDMLIPEDGDGTAQCSLFVALADPEAEEAERRRLAEQPVKYQEAMRARLVA